MGSSGSKQTNASNAGGPVQIAVPDMPLQGGQAQARAPNGQVLKFFVPAGYPPGTVVKTDYTMPVAPKAPGKTAAPKAGAAAPKAGAAAAPKAGAAAAPKASAAPAAPESQVSPTPMEVEATIVYREQRGMPVLPVQLPKMDGTWDWVRRENGELHRVTRLDAGLLLRETFRKGGYCTSEGVCVKFTSLASMIKGTRIVSYGDAGKGLPKLGADPKLTMEFEYGQGITPMEKSETMTLERFKVAAVNAASAYQAGGGFTSGGRHALEEAFCSQSTLYASLEKGVQLFNQGLQKGVYRNECTGYHQHIPSDGVLLSPNVEIFRGNTDQGYATRTRTVPVTVVVSVAMFNKNDRMHDSPVDAPSDPKLYEEGVRKKFTAMVHAAAMSGANAIIIPDAGCGVFKNDPKVCGRIVGEVLSNYSTRFRRAVFTGRHDFYLAAMQAASGARTVAQVATRSTAVPVDSQAHLLVGKCPVCNKDLGSNFSNIAILVDKTHKSHQAQFIRETCIPAARKKFPQKEAIMLPDITKNATSFLKALDLNGNGFVEKQELKVICALLWEGDLSKEAARFETEFEARFRSWDADNSGNVDMAQISGSFASVGGQASMNIGSMPQSCIEYVQEQARKKISKATR